MRLGTQNGIRTQEQDRELRNGIRVQKGTGGPKQDWRPETGLGTQEQEWGHWKWDLGYQHGIWDIGNGIGDLKWHQGHGK